MRLIDADAVPKEFWEYEFDGKWRGCTIKDLLDSQPTIQPEPHWIPVEQALPEEETNVLVTVHFLGLKQTHRNGWNDHIKESYYVEVASHINGEWSSASDEYKIAPKRHKVIAWCELPEPFKGVTE